LVEKKRRGFSLNILRLQRTASSVWRLFELNCWHVLFRHPHPHFNFNNSNWLCNLWQQRI
jgi:hypothetical protein